MYMKTQNFCQPIFYMQTAEKVLQGSQNPKKLDLKKKGFKNELLRIYECFCPCYLYTLLNLYHK